MSESTKLVDEAIDLSDDGKYKQAEKLLTKAIKLDGKNAQAFFERAMVLLNLDRDKAAVADFDACLAIDPKFPGARDWRAKAHAGGGKARLAAEDRLEALRDEPDGPPGMGVSPQNWAECAEAFAIAGEPATAVALLEEYLAGPAEKVTEYAQYETAPLRALARLLMKQSPDRAVTLASQAVGSKHHCPMDLLVHAEALESAGRKAEALKAAQAAMASNPFMPGVKELLIRCGGTPSTPQIAIEKPPFPRSKGKKR